MVCWRQMWLMQYLKRTERLQGDHQCFFAWKGCQCHSACKKYSTLPWDVYFIVWLTYRFSMIFFCPNICRMQELFPLVELMGNTVSVPCTCGFICVDSELLSSGVFCLKVSLSFNVIMFLFLLPNIYVFDMFSLQILHINPDIPVNPYNLLRLESKVSLRPGAAPPAIQQKVREAPEVGQQIKNKHIGMFQMFQMFQWKSPPDFGGTSNIFGCATLLRICEVPESTEPEPVLPAAPEMPWHGMHFTCNS